MRFARRVDRNHALIVRALRDARAEVMDIHAMPGCLDLLVGYRSVLYLLEVKDGELAPSDRKLTDAEQATILRFAGVGVKAHVVLNVEGALRAIGAIV